jgi:ClpP class serine protease
MIYNTPHLITPQAFDTILAYVEARNQYGIMSLMPMGDGGEDQGGEDKPDDLDDINECPMPIHLIDVVGTLTYKPVKTACGEVGMSYERLVDEVEDAIECGATTVVLNFGSGGGEAGHCFETANLIRSICDENKVKLIGYVDTMACSAAYALACICDELYANPSATVGSIGCVICLMDVSKAMEKDGYKRIFITSGDKKVPFDESGAFKQDFIDELQMDVDRLNAEFTNHVSNYTSIDAKTIKNWQAGCFNAQEALDNNLVSGIMTNREFVQYVVNNQEVNNA